MEQRLLLDVCSDTLDPAPLGVLVLRAYIPSPRLSSPSLWVAALPLAIDHGPYIQPLLTSS